MTAAQTAYLPTLKMAALNCPSSEMQTYGTDPSAAYGDPGAYQRSNYVGISGSAYQPSSPGTVLALSGWSYGWFVNNGALAANSKTRIRDMVDGTTNVIMVGEQGRPLNSAGTYGTDNRSTNWGGGAWSGCYHPGEPNVAPTGATADQFCNNLTNVAYGINNMAAGLTNADTPFKSSTVFSSRHVGGAHFLRGDGSVIFLSDNINFPTLLGLANMNDGMVLGDY